MDTQKDEEPVRGEHAEHHERTVGEIDDPHHPEDQGQANGG